MGQYHKVVNLDKKQYLHPHRFGDGIKLMEFGGSGDGTMLGLAILLANANNRGGGDLRSDHPIVGTWAGDRIVIAGDYADHECKGESGEETLYCRCSRNDDNSAGEFEDISFKVIDALCDDSWTRTKFAKSFGQFGFGEDMPEELKTKIGPAPAKTGVGSAT